DQCAARQHQRAYHRSGAALYAETAIPLPDLTESRGPSHLLSLRQTGPHHAPLPGGATSSSRKPPVSTAGKRVSSGLGVRPAQKQGDAIYATFHESQLLTMPATVAGHNVDIVVDTGAAVNAVSLGF
ncbi:unnamed protein product, partial [Ixodes hexagonus]